MKYWLKVNTFEFIDEADKLYDIKERLQQQFKKLLDRVIQFKKR